ncbi:putative polyprenyl synthetase [Thermogymnomonas acidicola]|uniref:Polyprenyl synthetase n=1 Tax=Thermogymnomonas acidicola TaxID=399579 RepID=A0AA37BQ95_9ARCH|nr:polyprenyl synthetase family protein [Thermogymnomonas acidicola]GGM69031.1 putative polyprenyl synthetase [Thermogymnomonas acidicola]
MSYERDLAEMKGQIDRSLSEFFQEKLSSVHDALTARVVGMIRDFTLNGGKRLRPIISILGHNIFEHEDGRMLKASLALELAQSYLLIHDDIMDESDMRRGRPTVHVEAGNIYASNPRRQKLGENIGIVAGDLAECYAHEVLMGSGFPPERLVRAGAELSSIIETTGYGQVLDIHSSHMEEFCQSDLMRLHLWKTSRYTVQGPLSFGSLLAGRDMDRNLSYYGYLAGVAFQLHDDILGLFGNQEVTGKPVRSDVVEGKKTLLILKAMEMSGESERKFIQSVLGNPGVTDDDLMRLRDIVVDSGSYQYSLDMMERLVSRAKEYLSRVPGDESAKDFLSWLADFMVRRSR